MAIFIQVFIKENGRLSFHKFTILFTIFYSNSYCLNNGLYWSGTVFKFIL
jgi:hypothetical protein